MEIISAYPQFFTASIYEMKHLLKQDKYKQIILDSLAFLVNDKRIYLYAFCIMSNHLHLIWQMCPGHKRENVQRDFLKFTGQAFRFDLLANHPLVFPHFEVNLKDRKYQFWQRNPLSIDLYNNEVFMQKLEYIHWNPVKAAICNLPETYKWSSAGFYENNDTEFSFLSHFSG